MHSITHSGSKPPKKIHAPICLVHHPDSKITPPRWLALEAHAAKARLDQGFSYDQQIERSKARLQELRESSTPRRPGEVGELRDLVNVLTTRLYPISKEEARRLAGTPDGANPQPLAELPSERTGAGNTPALARNPAALARRRMAANGRKHKHRESPAL
jgi:hypothetical protein